MKLAEMSISITGLIARPKRKKNGNYAKNLPTRKGKRLWMKNAFDLVITKEGCVYAMKHIVDNDQKVEGQQREVKICNECIFLNWDDGYMCTKE